MALEKILIVEDDVVTAMHLKMALEKRGYEVVAIAESSMQARNKIKIYRPSLVLLDISLEEEIDGINIATFLQEESQIPFIYLTSHTEQEVLDQAKITQPYGYIVKPFAIDSLHTTIQMAMVKFNEEHKKEQTIKRLENEKLDLEKLLYSNTSDNQPLVRFCTHFHLDLNTNDIYYKDKKVKLTHKENAFMALLVAHKNKTVNFEQAMNYVWEEEGATENSVRTLVWRLRNKLPEDIIQNVSGTGYILEDI